MTGCVVGLGQTQHEFDTESFDDIEVKVSDLVPLGKVVVVFGNSAVTLMTITRVRTSSEIMVQLFCPCQFTCLYKNGYSRISHCRPLSPPDT